MRQYKIVASILLIVPIINFALALPVIEAQETVEARSDLLHDVAVTTEAKRGGEDEVMGKLWDTYFEKSSGKSESSAADPPPSSSTLESDQHASPQNPSSSTVPDHESMGPHQMGTSEIQEPEVSPALVKSPSLNHYLKSTPTHPVADSESESGSFRTADSESVTMPSPPTSSVVNSKLKSLMNKMFSKLKFWGPSKTSGSGPSVRDAVNTDGVSKSS